MKRNFGRGVNTGLGLLGAGPGPSQMGQLGGPQMGGGGGLDQRGIGGPGHMGGGGPGQMGGGGLGQMGRGGPGQRGGGGLGPMGPGQRGGGGGPGQMGQYPATQRIMGGGSQMEAGIKSILKKSKGQSGYIKQSKGETARHQHQTQRPLLNEPGYYEDPQPRALLDDPPYVDEYPKRKPLLEEPSYYTDEQHWTHEEDSAYIGTYPKRNRETFSDNQSQRPSQEEPSYVGDQQPRPLMEDPIYMDEHPKRGSLLGEPPFMGENPGGRQLLGDPSHTMKGNTKRRPLLEDPYSQQNQPLLETPSPYREDQQEIYIQPKNQPRLEDPYFVDERPDKAPLFEDPDHKSWRSKRRPLLEDPDKPRIKPLMEEQDYMAERRPLLQDPDYSDEPPRQTPLLEDPKAYTDGLSDHRRALLEKPAYVDEQDERYGADNISESYGRNISQMPGRGGNPVEANMMRNQTEYRGEDVSRETEGRLYEDNTFGDRQWRNNHRGAEMEPEPSYYGDRQGRHDSGDAYLGAEENRFGGEKRAGMGGMANQNMQQNMGGTNQYGKMGMDGSRGMNNQMGTQSQMRPGMQNQMRPGIQSLMGSDMPSQMGSGMQSQMESNMQNQMGTGSMRNEMDRFSDQRGKNAGAGLLGRGPTEPLMGQRNQDMGYMNERQSGNFMEQQGRGSLGAEQSRFSAHSLNQQDRPMMQQANEMRGSNRPLMQQTNEMRGNNRPLMQPTNEMRGNNLMQQQQQSMMQQQQQRMQQGMMGKGDGLLGEAPTSSMMGQPAGNLNAARGGNIPSLFDLPSGRGVMKRPGDRMNRGMDNKKPRPAFSPPDRQRGQKRADTRREQPDKHRENRSSGQRKSRFDQSPSERRDRKDSGSQRSTSSHRSDSKGTKDHHSDSKGTKDSSRQGRGRDSSRSSKSDQKSDRTVNTQVTVTVEGGEYDPANPTAEEEDGDEVEEISLKINEAEVLELISRDDETEDNGILVKAETGDSAEMAKTDKIKSESEEKSGSLTVTVSKNKKGRSVADSDAQGESEEKKHYRCNVCNINCYKEISFASHLKGQKHMKMMESVMKVTEARSHQIAARLQAESHLRKIEGHSGTTKSSKSPSEKKPAAGSGKVLESHCKTCDKKFTGAYRDHKDKDEHKERDSLRRDGCKICSISTFSNYNNYAIHLQSKTHIKKSYPHCHICKQWFKSPRKFVQHCKTDHHLENKSQRGRHKDDTTDVDEMSELVTLDVVGFEDETGADKEEDMDVTEGNKTSTTMNLEALTPMMSRAKATSTPKPRQLSSEEERIVVPEKYDPEAAVGQSYIVPVSGYFCKLCHKFYNNEDAAKTIHCQSEMHYERYKKIMVSKASTAKSKEENSIKPDITADDQSVNSTKDNDQSLSSTKNNSQSLATEASNYQTADEQQDSTLQKTTDSSQDTAKQLPNGSSTVDSSKEIDSQNDKDTKMDAQDDDKKDSDQDDVLIVGESKGMGRGAASTRGTRNKARRAKRV